MTYRPTSLVLFPTLFSLLLLSCKDDAPNDDGPVIHTVVIGPDGGTVDDGKGTRLVIPPGALSESVEISMTTYSDAVALGQRFPNLFGALWGVELKPDGLEFDAAGMIFYQGDFGPWAPHVGSGAQGPDTGRSETIFGG